MNIISPCFNCSNRHIGCHSNCELYIKFRKEKDKENSIIKSEKNKINEIEGHILYSTKCMKRRKGTRI